MALELYPLPLTPSLPPTPAHHQVILMGQPLIESSFCHEKKSMLTGFCGWFFLFLTVTSLQSFTYTFCNGEKKVTD